MGARKMFETAFAIGGKLDPSFDKALGTAQKQLATAFKKGGEAAALTAAQKQITSSMKNIGQAASKMGASWGNVVTSIVAPLKTIGVLGAAGGAAVYGLATTTAKLGSDAITAAKKVGITTQEYSKLNYAASQSGVSQETLSSSMKKLNQTTIAAAKGNKEARLAFERAGVSIYGAGGKLKSTNQIMLEASNMFAKMPEGVYKADLAMALFGKSGADMVPLMEKGSKEIEHLGSEAERLGLVFSEQEGMNAAGFMDSLNTVKSAVQGLGIAVGKHLHEPLMQINKAFTEWIIANREWIGLKAAEVVEEFKKNLPAIKKFLINAKDAVVSFAKSVNSVAQAMGGWPKVIKGVAMAWAALKVVNIVVAIAGAVKSTMAFVAAVKMALAAIGAILTKLGALGAIKALGAAILGISAPVAIAIATVAGLIAIGVLVYKKWDSIVSKVKAILAGLSSFVSDIMEIIGNTFNAGLQGFSEGIDIFVNFWKQAWDGLGSFFGEIIDIIKSSFSAFIDGMIYLIKEFNIYSLLNKLIMKIFDIDLLAIGQEWIGGLVKGILGGVSGAAGVVKNAVGGMLSGLPGIGNLFGDTKKVAESIPKHGNGGFITSPQIAMVGEDGPEVILPLSKPSRMKELLSQISPSPAESLSRAVNNNNNSSTSIGGASFNFAPVINVGGGDSASVETAVRNALSDARNYFERWINERERNNARVAIA
jgi:hypothetical protein